MELKEWLGENNTLGIDIWKKKYQYNDETLEEWFDRVSGGNEEVKELIKNKKFLFGGRILAHRGISNKKVTYSNCYVIGAPDDNIESIFDAAKKLARTFSMGGGCGIDIGKLAPKGAKVNNAAKESTGAVSFMDLYDITTGIIGQAGRRGALMLSIPVNHPDIYDFIKIKTDLHKINNANISVRVDNKFMHAVENNEDYILSFTRPETGEKIEKVIKAKELFNILCKNNWDYAEPGMLFWDNIEGRNMLTNDPNFKYDGVNPCAEEPLPRGGACLLGAINLAEFVTNPFTNMARFDIIAFKEAVKIAVYALNEVLEEGLELHPLEEQRESVGKWRQIGCGIFGLADCLIKLGFVYGSKTSNKFCEKIAKEMFKTAVLASDELGGELGAYEAYNREAINSSPMLKELGIETEHLRNSQLLTVAPTGTISTMLGVSGGIEPIFANSYNRKTITLHKEEVFYKVYTPIVAEYMKMYDITDESKLPPIFVVASSIKPINRINCQAAWQKWIDASISSTVNLPNECTVEDIENIYMEAWKSGLKGITVYRAGCAREGILVTDETKNNTSKKTEINEKPRGHVVAATNEMIGMKRKLITGCGSLHCLAYFDAETKDLREVYLSKGSTGGCNNFMIGLSRMISLSARAGVTIDDIIDQLNSCGVCPSYAVRKATKNDTSPGACCPMAVGKALLDMHKELVGKKEKETNTSGAKCPTCSERLVQEGGCIICKNCGYSKCD